MRRWLSLALPMSMFFAGCTDDPPPEESKATGPFAAVHAQAGGIGAFPSDIYTVPDANTYTGLRVKFSAEDDKEFMGGPYTNVAAIPHLNTLDGFGTSGGGWIRFTTPLKANVARENTNVFFGYLDESTPVLVPTELNVFRDQIVLRPDLPLPPNRHAFMATTIELEDENGDAYQPNPELKQILAGNLKHDDVLMDEALAQRVKDTAQALVDAKVLNSTSELASLTVFTTQSIHETDLEVAAKIRDFDPIISIGDEPCEDVPLENVRLCYFDITIANYTSDDHTIADDAADHERSYTVTATLFLPRPEDADYPVDYDVEAGFPVAVFGHGLTGTAHQAVQIARYTARQGIATIGLDAPQHGTHPMRANPEGAELNILFDLFGIQGKGRLAVHPFVLRDGWRQSTFDKLGLIEAIKKGIDLDGDGFPDLDATRISYLGASLGAIQAPELLALSEDIDLALLAVGGARVSDIVRFGDTFAMLMPLVFPKANNGAVLRSLVFLQGMIERGDGVNWAPYVMQNRLIGEEPPHIAMQVSIPDEVVPPETGIMLARTLGVPIIGTPVRSDRHLGEESAPALHNHSSGKTVGMIQMDWMHRGTDPEWRTSTHDKSPDSVEAIAFWEHVFLTMYRDGKPTLIDPYTLPGSDNRPEN